jgi:hypothetical protein
MNRGKASSEGRFEMKEFMVENPSRFSSVGDSQIP